MPRLILNYFYNDLGLRSEISDNLNATILFSYNPFDSLSSASWGAAEAPSLTVSLSSDAVGRTTEITREDGQAVLATTMLTYDIANRVTSIAHSAGATQLATFTYGYTPRGDLTSYSGPEGAVTFAYDDTRQLTSATGARSETYSYDANGNRTLAGYTTGPNNRLLSDGVYNYEYDDEGNRTRRTHIATGETHDYSWDHRNRLTMVIIKNSGGAIIREARFTYDVDNNLLVRWTDPDGAGAQAADQLFTAYDGMHAYADFDASGALTQRYLYGDQPDQLLAVIEADGDPNFPLTDNLGSVRQYINALGVVLNETTFDSFGNILTETNPSAAIRQSFTGRELDRSIGLYWYRARWYDPAAGRFVSEDPIHFLSHDLNLSRYAINSPLRFIDPSGQSILGVSIDPEARRGQGPWGQSAQHCWAACFIAATFGPIAGQCAAAGADIREVVRPSSDSWLDIIAQHVGAGLGTAFYPTNPISAALGCDNACLTSPNSN